MHQARARRPQAASPLRPSPRPMSGRGARSTCAAALPLRQPVRSSRAWSPNQHGRLLSQPMSGQTQIPLPLRACSSRKQAPAPSGNSAPARSRGTSFRRLSALPLRPDVRMCGRHDRRCRQRPYRFQWLRTTQAPWKQSSAKWEPSDEQEERAARHGPRCTIELSTRPVSDPLASTSSRPFRSANAGGSS